MELIAEIIVNLVFMLVIFMIKWGRQHKEATIAILLAGLAVVDIVFVLSHFGVI